MCQCIPASNIACDSQSGIGLAQPSCQVLPDGSNNVNPYFDTVSNQSFWTYKVLNFCTVFGTELYIPIYENISLPMLTVAAFILNCGRFEDVIFDFANPPGVTPPVGFQFIRIPFTDLFTQGATGVFRLSIVGNYPQVNGTLYVNSASGLQTYTAGYLVPGVPPNPRLTVTKVGVFTANGNQGSIDYTVTVTNTGNVDLDDVLYVDVINYNGNNLIIGPIIVDPSITVDTSVPDTIRLTSNLGTILMGGNVVIMYTVPIESFSAPDSYNFASATMVMNAETQASTNTAVIAPAVQIGAEFVCNINDSDTGSFNLTLSSIPNSPDTMVESQIRIVIPNSVTVQFLTFGTCEAVFEGTTTSVPINTDITGNSIIIDCSSSILSNASALFSFPIRIISSNSVPSGISQIMASLIVVVLAMTTNQAFLGTTPVLPINAEINVDVDAECQNNCTNT